MSKKIQNISIIGIGRLGICVGLCLEHSGYSVMGVDISKDYVDKINKKTFKSHEPSVTKMLLKSKNFKATVNINEALSFSDIILIYVATPSSGGENYYDHTMLGKVLMQINKLKVEHKHIVIGCTVIPGYIRDVGNFLIKDCKNTTLSYNPEFIAQGDIINGMFSPDFILIGEGSKDAGDKLEQMYTAIGEHSPKKHVPIIRRMSPISAEIAKLSVNCFVTTKIAFANMIGDVADITGGKANKYDILKAVGSDKRIGNKYLNPGYSFGGPCFPRDNRALGKYIKSVGINPLIPMTTDQSNKEHTQFQIKQHSNFKQCIITGVGYKSNCSVPIIEESPTLIIGKSLVKKGIKVIVRDTKLMLDCVRLEYGNIFQYEVIEVENEVIEVENKVIEVENKVVENKVVENKK
jgi:UDPglucose 6-dehydrogenase